MCGRFTQKSERPDIQLAFYIDEWKSDVIVSYNVTPGQRAGVVYKHNDRIYFDLFRWGLIPGWSKDPKIGFKMINARAETVHQKPSFKRSFKSRRCLIPVNGFFEWKTEEKRKTPYYIFLKDLPLFSLAGLWDEWISPERIKIYTFTIVTTEANELVAAIHEKKRMPVIIGKQDRDLWLNIQSYEKDLLELLAPYDTKKMDAYEVSRVGPEIMGLPPR